VEVVAAVEVAVSEEMVKSLQQHNKAQLLILLTRKEQTGHTGNTPQSMQLI
tara:strand:+ start:116 stop:268 length:153 start_codon:yes stop_codon:yes gene_type:complete